MTNAEIIALAREAGFKVDWQHADVAEIKAQRYVTFARAIEAAVLEKLQTQEPVAVAYDFDGYGWRYIDNGSGSHWLERGKNWKDHLLLYAAPVQQNPAKDHEVAALVNRLRHIATVYHDHQSLRERIAQEIRPMFAAPTQHEEIDPDSRTISVYPVQQDVNKQLLEALTSIAKNTCCDTCQEAARVARAAIAAAEGK